MASRIEQLTQTNGALLHDISHELRSPLTRLQAAIGLLRKDSTQASALIERIEREGERLDMLLEDRLTLHRMCAGLSDVAPQRVDVVELLQSIAHDADFEALATQRILRLETPGSFVVEAHGDLLYRTFANVIRNALKFSPPGSAIDVSACLSDRGKTLVTTVKDRGPGVSSEMLQAIFDPVASVAGGEPVRGIGLSLAIAQRVIFLHGGQIEAASREGGGLIVMLSLPRCN